MLEIKLWCPQGGLTYKTLFKKSGNQILPSYVPEFLEYYKVDVVYKDLKTGCKF